MTAEQSLAAAEASLRGQERKHAAEQPVRARLARLKSENHLSELLRAALGGQR